MTFIDFILQIKLYKHQNLNQDVEKINQTRLFIENK